MPPIRSLNLICRPKGDEGIAVHARAIAAELRPRLQRFSLLAALRRDESWFRTHRVVEGLPDPEGDTLIFYWPSEYARHKLGRRRLGYFVFEYDRLREADVRALNAMDAVCTASAWGRRVLEANGVRVPILLFRGGGRAVDAPPAPDTGAFRFLHVGKYEARKGTDQLIRCFNAAFEGRPDVRLTLSIDNPHLSGFSAEKVLAEAAKGLKHPVGNVDVLHHVPDLGPVYLAHHCLVLPTRGEAVGLPVLEAMGHGLACIVSHNSGITEYADDSNALLLKDLSPVPVFDPLYFPRAGEQGHWLAPGDDELVAALRHAASHPQEMAALGQRARRFVAERFTWAQAVQGFLEESARLL